MSTLKTLRERKKIIVDLGAEIKEIEHTGKTHLKLNVEYLGNKKILICSNSGSDVRELKNFKGDLTKWIRSIKNV